VVALRLVTPVTVKPRVADSTALELLIVATAASATARVSKTAAKETMRLPAVTAVIVISFGSMLNAAARRAVNWAR